METPLAKKNFAIGEQLENMVWLPFVEALVASENLPPL